MQHIATTVDSMLGDKNGMDFQETDSRVILTSKKIIKKVDFQETDSRIIKKVDFQDNYNYMHSHTCCLSDHVVTHIA